MGTQSRHDFNEHGDGNWTNPQVQAENQRVIYQETQGQSASAVRAVAYGTAAAYQHTLPQGQGQGRVPQAQTVPASSYPVPVNPAPLPAYPYPAKPPYRIFRRFFCSLLALFTLLCGLAGATAYWAQSAIVDTDNFTAMAQGLATDQDFQNSLASAVTDDIMASPTISTYLGDGKSETWYGGAQNWLYDQTYTLVNQATGTVVASEDYPELWAKAMSDSHRYNFSGETRPAMLDFSAIYDKASDSLRATTGISLDTSALPGRTLMLDTGESIWPVNTSINTLIGFAGLWPILLVGCAGSALLGFLLWPGSKCAHLACVAFMGAGLLWATALIGGGASWLSGLGQGASSSGVLFFQKLSQLIAESFASYLNGLAFEVLIAAVVLTLLAILIAVLRVTARPATARFR